MKAKNICNKFGKIKVCMYEPISNKDTQYMCYRSVVSDIYNKSNYNGTIVWISKVIPFKNFHICDVIKDYVSTISEDCIILTQAGTLGLIPESATAEEGLAKIRLERDNLFLSDMVNITFNRVMSSCYGNPEVFVLDKTKSGDFIESNIGDDKIISYIKTIDL